MQNCISLRRFAIRRTSSLLRFTVPVWPKSTSWHSCARFSNESARKRSNLADPNARIAFALIDAVRVIIPDSESVDRYSEEIKARSESRRAATAGMIVTLIDQQAFLDPAQQDSLAAALLENWNPDWSGAPILVMYPMYSTLPDADLLRPHLTRPATKTVDLSTSATQRDGCLGISS